MSVCACGAGGQLRRGKCHTCYERHRTRQHLYGRWQSNLVPAEPVRAHVTAVHDTGVSYRQLAVLSGVSRSAIRALFVGKTGNGAPERVWRSTADRLLAVPVPEAPVKVAAPADLIPAVGSVRRLRALVATGYTQTYLAGRLGMTPANFGTTIHGKYKHLTARRVRHVLELWAELQMVPGPSEAARRYGASMRWPLPMQWTEDDLDNPDAGPVRGSRRISYRRSVA